MALQPPPHLLTTLPAPAGGGRCGSHGPAGHGRRPASRNRNRRAATARSGADSRAAPRGGVRRRRRAARPVVLERPADSTSLTAAEAAVDKSATVAAGCFRAPPRREPRPAGNGRPWVLAGYLRTAGHRGVAGVRPRCPARRSRSAPRWSPSIAGRSSGMRRPSMRFTCGRLLERKHPGRGRGDGSPRLAAGAGVAAGAGRAGVRNAAAHGDPLRPRPLSTR